MTQTDFILTYIIPFTITFIVFGINEYRLYRINKITYETFVNSTSMLIVSMLSFILIQTFLKYY